jgi:hypothetical protein
MRKILTGLASGALVLSMAAPAFAAPTRPENSMTRSKMERDYRDGRDSDWRERDSRDGRDWDRGGRDYRDDRDWDRGGRDYRDGWNWDRRCEGGYRSEYCR